MYQALALVVSEIIGGIPNLHYGPYTPRTPASGKILTHPKVLAYTYIAVTFQLRSSTMRLTESSLSIIGFALKGPPQWVFGVILGEGAKIFSGKVHRIARFQTSLVQI